MDKFFQGKNHKIGNIELWRGGEELSEKEEEMRI